MTDPLLTIEDATREFRVSPKTIRRRLTSGEITGAYKRPGNRGPEWVMPRQSLTAAGFLPRPTAAPTDLPTDAEERASYWERRATDAEAALRGAGTAGGRGRRPLDLGGLGWAFIAVSLLVALLVGLLVADSGDASDAGADPPTAGTMGLVAALLERETDPGDAIGLVGERRTDALPEGRVAAASPPAGWQSSSGPRFVVAVFDDAGPPTAVADLRSTSEVVLRAPHAGLLVEVYDRRSVPAGAEVAAPSPSPPASETEAGSATPEPAEPVVPADGPATDPQEAGSPTGPVGPIAPGAGAPPPAGSGGAPGADSGEPEVQAASPTPSTTPGDAVVAPGETAVQEGESFWTIAETVVAGELGPDAPETAVASYWSALVSANADRLVEPGNADLLHVGQSIALPPLT